MANDVKVKFKRGNKSELDAMPIVDGQLLYNTETGETFEDVEDKRISTSGVVTSPQQLSVEQQKTARNNISALTSHGITGAKPGDLMRITSVDEIGTPTALEPVTLEDLEGKWELIEKLTTKNAAAFMRDKEPDGKPYLFRGIIVKFHAPDTFPAFITNVIVGSDTVAQAWTRPANEPPYGTYSYVKAKRDLNLWQSSGIEGTANQSGNIAGITTSVYGTTNPRGWFVTKIETVIATVPAGTEIEIWAIRR